jgi:hypothetical protein
MGLERVQRHGYAYIPDFSAPIPVRTPAERRAARAVALDLHPLALEPAQATSLIRAAEIVGEFLAAAIIIGGGMLLIGFASLH